MSVDVVQAAQRHYVTALQKFKREVAREQDRAQLGQDPGADLLIYWAELLKARIDVQDALREHRS